MASPKLEVKRGKRISNHLCNALDGQNMANGIDLSNMISNVYNEYYCNASLYIIICIDLNTYYYDMTMHLSDYHLVI